MSRLHIAWTAAKLAMLKAQCEAAVAERKDQFEYIEKEEDSRWSPVMGRHPMLVSYAKYLIEYLDSVFESTPTPKAPENREGEEGQ